MQSTGAPYDRLPRLDAPRFICASCGAFAQQSWESLCYEDPDGGFAQLGTPQELGLPSGSWPASAQVWKAALCGGCMHWSIWRNGEMVYPPPRLGSPPHSDMPADARELYVEAAAVASASRRAAAALARATIERLLKSLDPEAPRGFKLDQRIQRIRPKVSTPLGQLLDVVRVSGNDALHVDDQPREIIALVLDDAAGAEVVELLLETANDLVDELITRPRTAQELWDKLPAGIREKARSPSGSEGITE